MGPMYGWHPHAVPDEATAKKMQSIQKDAIKEIFEIDGHQMMHNLIDGQWYIYEEPETENV